MALLNKLLGKDEREEKLKQEIKSLELRKESVLASINGEIANLQSEQRRILLEAGKHGYDIWCKDNLQADLVSYYENVSVFEDKIKEQEVKKKEMTDRYDEEIKLIANNLNSCSVNSGNSVAEGSVANYPNCGFRIATDDAFCQKCGAKLR